MAPPKYLDYRDRDTALGHYQVVAITGTVGAGISAQGAIFSARWGDAEQVAVLQEVVVEEFYSITGFTAGLWALNLWLATGFTVSDSGGAAVVLTTHEQQLRASKMGASLFTDMRVATTAALTAGTRTLHTRPTQSVRGHVGTAAAQHIIPPPTAVTTAEVAGGPGVVLYKADIANGEHPIVLDKDEGFIIGAVMPATGTWVASIRVKWAELNGF